MNATAVLTGYTLNLFWLKTASILAWRVLYLHDNRKVRQSLEIDMAVAK